MIRRSNYLLIVLMILAIAPGQVTAQADNPAILNPNIKNWAKQHANRNWKTAIEEAERAYDSGKLNSDTLLMATALNRQGQSYLQFTNFQRRNRKTAREKFKTSLFLLTETNDRDLKTSNLKFLTEIAKKEGNEKEAAIYQNQISDLKNNTALINQIDSLDEQTEVLSQKVNALKEDQLKSELIITLQKSRVDSLTFHALRDSLELALQENQIEFQANQLDLQKAQKRFFIALIFIIGLLALGAILSVYKTRSYNTKLRHKTNIIDTERKKSEKLLLNILPKTVAKELKENGKTTARRFEHATVLFTDFANFTTIARSWPPEKLVDELDFYFKAFDEIIIKHNLEKIKTIGDAYMCVGGLPEQNDTHAHDAVRAAIEIQQFLKKVKREKSAKGENHFEARIGIHTGSLVAGVVGSSKFAFDIWGDTVNVASRFENQSEPEQINISGKTRKLVDQEFDCTFRGKIPIKHLGEVSMYFVNY